MKESNVVQEKSESFAVRICKLHDYLVEQKKERTISNQILRSGCSIGANIAEAIYAESTDDFIHKLKIARKECSETGYWLRILHRSEKISEAEYESLRTDNDTLLKLLTKIIKSSVSN